MSGGGWRMPKGMVRLIWLFFFAGIFCCITPVEAAQQPMVRVGLWKKQMSTVVSGSPGLAIYVEESRTATATFRSGEKIVITSNQGGFALNGKPLKGHSLLLRPEGGDGASLATVEVNRRQYRGTVELRLTEGGQGFTIINSLPLEQYLYGVLAREMPPEWAPEALRAQAVAARSYALYSLAFSRKHAADGYDVCATTDCQVYGGVGAEHPRVLRAVDSTAGEAMYYRGKVINALFHTSAGGYTENSEAVWGTYIPYLRAVQDVDRKAPLYRWEHRYSAVEIGERLKNGGILVGPVQGFELSALQDGARETPDRGTSGRVKRLRVVGANGSAEVSALKLRQILGLESTLFDLRIETDQSKTMEVPLTLRTGETENKAVPIKLPPMESRGLLTDSKSMHRFNGKAGEVLVVWGFGAGHGLGMSQWGAKALAEKNKDVADYYMLILGYYYQGIVIERAY